MTATQTERLQLNLHIDRQIIDTRRKLSEHILALTDSCKRLAEDKTFGINTYLGHLKDIKSFSHSKRDHMAIYAKIVRQDNTFPYRMVSMGISLLIKRDEMLEIHQTLYSIYKDKYTKEHLINLIKQDSESELIREVARRDRARYKKSLLYFKKRVTILEKKNKELQAKLDKCMEL